VDLRVGLLQRPHENIPEMGEHALLKDDILQLRLF
jgi:hypothetical protein